MAYLRHSLSDVFVAIDDPDRLFLFALACRLTIQFSLLFCGCLVLLLCTVVTRFVCCVPELPKACHDCYDEQAEGDKLGHHASHQNASM